MDSKTSFISSDDVIESKSLIREHLGFSIDTLPAERMAVKIFVRGEDIVTFKDSNGEQRSIEIPTSISCNDQYTNAVALVIAQGPNCYQGDEFERSGPWCRVGDWVVIPRQGGRQITYRGFPIQIIHQTGIWMVIEDPEYIERY